MTFTKGVQITVRVVTMAGAGIVLGNIIKMSTPASAHIVTKVLTGIGGFVLTSMVADSAADYAVKQVDELLESVKSLE